MMRMICGVCGEPNCVASHDFARATRPSRDEQAVGEDAQRVVERSEKAEQLVKRMVNRFLQWKLPKDFHPDNGISCQRPNYGPNVTWEPVGTNLLSYEQTEAMVLHMLDGEQLTALRAKPADEGLRELLREAGDLLRRYREEIPIGHSPHMLYHKADEALARIDAALEQGK